MRHIIFLAISEKKDTFFLFQSEDSSGAWCYSLVVTRCTFAGVNGTAAIF